MTPSSPVHKAERLVDLDRLQQNAVALQKMMQPATFCAVLKNNAYGHGLRPCAEALAATGITDFALVDNDEFAVMRSIPALQQARLWRIRPALRCEVEECAVQELQVIEQLGSLDELEWARSLGDNARFCLVLDCSIGREGFPVPQQLEQARRMVSELGTDRIAGVMGHLANADGDAEALAATRRELEVFDAALASLQELLSPQTVIHVANSSAGLRLPQVRHDYDMVRIGAALFGETNSPLVINPREVQPCLTWRTWVAQVRTLPAGKAVGYGHCYVTAQEEQVATLPIGYADGLKKGLGNGCGEVLVRGVRCPILGTVSSGSTVIRVEHLPGERVQPGEEVVLIGHQSGAEQSPDQLAIAAGTGHLDLQTGITAPFCYQPEESV